MHIHHDRGARDCIGPDHFRLIEPKEHARLDHRSMGVRGRKEMHFNNGHGFDEAGTYVSPSGHVRARCGVASEKVTTQRGRLAPPRFVVVPLIGVEYDPEPAIDSTHGNGCGRSSVTLLRPAILRAMATQSVGRSSPSSSRPLVGRPTKPPPRRAPSANRRSSPPEASIHNVPVDKIRPEEGLSRRRDREGHEELCRSISQFGVLTPITVRPADDGSGEFLLIKGQGRTLACRRLGIPTVPAHIMPNQQADSEKVSQFLVENIARLRMRPVDRALLVSRARKEGEETASVAQRFGISASTVRRLEAQLDGAGPGELHALRTGSVNLALHSVISRRVPRSERETIIAAIGQSGIRAQEMDQLLTAIGWASLVELGPSLRDQRTRLIEWACASLADLPKASTFERIQRLASALPSSLPQAESEWAIS